MKELLERLPFWEHLSGEERTLAAEAVTLRHYPAGTELLTGQQESCLGMLYVLSGEVRSYLLSFEGREITLFRVFRDECCVLSASCVISRLRFDTQLSVTEDADILILPSSVIGMLADRNIHVRCFLYEVAAERFSAVMEVMQSMLFSRFDQRLAAFLVQEQEETGKKELHMTQEQIARNVNSVREVVSRMLKQFAAEGLIEYRRGTVEIKDLPRLKALADRF